MFFGQEQRNKLKESEPGLAFGEVGKRLGQMWSELSESGKKVHGRP